MYLSVAMPFFQWNIEKVQVFGNNILFPQVSLILRRREVLCGHCFHDLCLQLVYTCRLW